MCPQTNQVSHNGKPINLLGDGTVEPGAKVPDVRLSRSNTDEIQLSDFRGRILVLNVIPAINTRVCTLQTKRFDEDALGFDDDVVIITISMDPPAALTQWCHHQNVNRIVTTSDHRRQEFGKKFSLLMKGTGYLARSVFVIDRDGVLRYREIVGRMEDEPDYDAVLEAVRGLVIP